MKQCKKCLQFKPKTEFFREKRNRDGLDGICKKCNMKQAIKWAKRNPIKVKIYKKRWREKNKEWMRRYSKKWRQNNKNKRYEAYKAWRKNNPEKARAIQRKSNHKILATIQGNLNHRMGVMIRQSLKENKNGRHWEDLVGYTLDDLKQHLEKLFTSDMSWEKLLNGEIHIDHIKPKSLFKYETAEDKEFKKCWGLENLQPLERIANIKKSNKYFNPLSVFQCADSQGNTEKGSSLIREVQVHLEKMKTMTKKTIGKIAMPLSKTELMDRAYRKKCRELKIARTRASVLRSQITRSYEILENIRFDFLGDTMFREYIVGAKRELEGAISDFLLSDTYWDEKIKKYRKMTPEEYHQENNQSGQSPQSK